MRVQSFGGPVERGDWNIPNGVPDIGAFPVGWNRSAQAGPWLASFPCYGSPDEDFTIQRVWRTPGGNPYIRGPFGGTGFLGLTPQRFAALHPTPGAPYSRR